MKIHSRHLVWLLALVISVSTLLSFSPNATAQSRAQTLEKLQQWSEQTRERRDLEAYEQDLRQQLIRRLIFQTERKYRGGSWSSFLIQNLEEMTASEEEPTRSFLLELLRSLNVVLEPREDGLLFVKSFLEFSGIQEPASLEEFAATRNYTDGIQMQSAHPVSADEAGDYLEQKENAPRRIENEIENSNSDLPDWQSNVTI